MSARVEVLDRRSVGERRARPSARRHFRLRDRGRGSGPGRCRRQAAVQSPASSSGCRGRPPSPGWCFRGAGCGRRGGPGRRTWPGRPRPSDCEQVAGRAVAVGVERGHRLLEEVGAVGDHAVDAELQQLEHAGRVVDRPGDDLVAGGLDVREVGRDGLRVRRTISSLAARRPVSPTGPGVLGASRLSRWVLKPRLPPPTPSIRWTSRAKTPASGRRRARGRARSPRS